MKVHELLEVQIPKTIKVVRGTDSVTLITANKTLLVTIDDLKDSETGKYFTDVVNVKGQITLSKHKLTEFPVQFGEIDGNFYCYNNDLTSLEGGPQTVTKGFNCSQNKLTSLKGAPREIGGSLHCHNNKLTSLKGVYKIIKKIGGHCNVSYNPIKSGGIGLLLIEELTHIYSDLSAFDIINKYLGKGKKGLLACQEELIEAGLEEYAKL